MQIGLQILTNEPSIWVQAMKTKYLHTGDFLTYKRKATESPVWKNLLKYRSLVKHGLIWKLGNGENISFWYDN